MKSPGIGSRFLSGTGFRSPTPAEPETVGGPAGTTRPGKYSWRSKSTVVQIPLINVAASETALATEEEGRGSRGGDEGGPTPPTYPPAVKGFDAV